MPPTTLNSEEPYFHPIRHQVAGHEVASPVSQVLITKIVLGTLGCVPAYDRFFGIGVKYLGLEKDSCNEESFLELADFYEAHNDRLEEARRGMQCEVLTYPQMKLLDMGFGRSGSCEHKEALQSWVWVEASRPPAMRSIRSW